MQRLSRYSFFIALAALLVTLVTGCDAPIDAFQPNEIYARRFELTESVPMTQPLSDADDALTDLFGTPDEPIWPSIDSDVESRGLLSADRLGQAAGPVSSDEEGRHVGLYREHCVVCHGITGDGLGPSAALLSPYPRDFRLGKFKFKSTPIGRKPTREDLKRTLVHGIVGTGMPSFALLEDEELEALVDYVIYLSTRGELERRLLTTAATELDFDAGERLYDADSKESEPAVWQDQWDLVITNLEGIETQWLEADKYALSVPEPPLGMPIVGISEPNDDALKASIENGLSLFQGQVASCAFCHGPDARGDGQQNNYDEWTRDWTAMAGLNPKNKAELEPMFELGALKPRNALPRNLRLGAFRGGARAQDLYTRIVNGIEGTPMPAAPLKPENPQGLTQREVWDLVNYLLHLRQQAITGGKATSSNSVASVGYDIGMQTASKNEKGQR